ncbi:MAG: ISL3 family transposase [Rhodobacteraceae bacterium]|nr:ISL3 family transposase [Paracoccaceae bacterium]
MQLKTILNRVERHKSFVYGSVRFADRERNAIEVEMLERANSRPVCSGCGRGGPGYDRLPERRYQYVPLWALAVFLVYAPRRVDCRRCGVKVERVPWAEGKSQQTKSYQWFLASWSKRLPWQQVAEVFHTSWQTVYRSVQMAVAWGLAHRNLDNIEAIGVDEIAWKKGHNYLTLVYQIDGNCKRLLHIAPKRTVRSLLSFFRMLGEVRSAALKFVCSDMWQAYLKVIAKKASQAVHVLDRFHIMVKMNKAIDEVRRAEVKRLKRDGYEHILKNSRWCLLKRPENLTDKETVKLSEVLKYNLQTVRARLQREDFQRFWEYRSPYWAACFLTEWCNRVMRSRIEPMKKVAKSLRSHGELILNWFIAKGTISAGMVEGLNYNVKLSLRKSYGFRTEEALETVLYHRMGALPEPAFAHKFW